MLAVASSLFNRSSISANYQIHSQQSASASPAFGASSNQSDDKPFYVGLWKIVRATNKTTQKVVSVWILNKNVLDSLRGPAKDQALEVLKKEATSLSRLRHPSILETVEPMEESRSELMFATELILSSLASTLSSARPGGVLEGVDLDEVEIQKGILQITHGLSFLHTQAKIIHQNISPEAVLINLKGDWKLGALGLTTTLSDEGGSGGRWVFPEWDSRMPESLQRKWDYMAPEYALDEQLCTSSDLYSLGCVIYAVHLGGRPPFQNRNALTNLRQNVNQLGRGAIGNPAAWGRLSNDLKDILSNLITRYPQNRLTALTLPSHPFFSNMAISTLLFLDRSTFSSKPKEEKATFLRGLLNVLPTFSERLRKRKILPSLLEEMKDAWLLPFILPNVFEISKSQSLEEFNAITLAALKPLFSLTDPPQNMLTLLNSLPLFMEKTNPRVFRENIMPLIYNSLDSEHPEVQEKALAAIPNLLDVLDVGSVQDVLFVRVAILFTKTRVLSVKVKTLECFLAMINVLDKMTLTSKLVPLLAKIKTKEPDVMMATLNVHERMGAKVDREAVATLVLPQLWTFSMGPLLNLEQFNRFMSTIKTLGNRIETEQAQHLRENQRIQSQTTSGSSFTDALNGRSGSTGEVTFESLVGGASKRSTGRPVEESGSVDPWGDDSWDSVPTGVASSPMATTMAVAQPVSQILVGSNSRTKSGGGLGARPLPFNTINPSLFMPKPIAPATASAPASALSSSTIPSPNPNTLNNLSFPTPPMNSHPTQSYNQRPKTMYDLSVNSPAVSSFTSNTRTPTYQPSLPPGYASGGVLQPTMKSSSHSSSTGLDGRVGNLKAVADEFDPFS
ncbi:kinase-like protein [Phaffia rhodozyma]|uniref:Kinase-like protein n=1 Tax=Phaffia rhodozyma TaxID=264483 RepID=A0A0F7SP44_PHARH|nr:kinase-like protein [Phaffia rhodozyma]